jgi:SAM-dependent methyltransferase
VGLTAYFLDYLAHAVETNQVSGSVLTLSRLDMYFGLDELQLCAQNHRIAHPERVEEVRARGELFSTNPRLRSMNFVSDHATFAMFGFDSVESVDASAFENATHIFDLNAKGLRDTLGRRDFDLVIEAGTMEHVFHIPNFLENMLSVVKVGGCALHISPTNNSVDHGFYQFSPTFFHDYYAANNWKMLEISFVRYESFTSKTYFQNAPAYFNYSPGSLQKISEGGLDDKMYGTVMVARRMPDSTIGVIPSQGLYTEAWAKDEKSESR